MAKPEFASLAAATPGSSANANARHSMPSPSSSSNRVNRAPRSRARQTSPSAVLALLSAVYASPLAVYGHPLGPLPFLYPPFLHRTDTALAKRASPDASTSTATTSPPPPPPWQSGCQQQDEHNLPDRYVLAEDNRWHKKTSWSLYGSLCCPGPCVTPPSVTDALQNDIKNPQGSGPTEHPPPTDEFNIASLPTGWNSVHYSNTHHSTGIILALSVALAAVILILFSIIFWRRKHTPKRDPEKKGGMASNIADDDSFRSIREAKAAQRKWYKAVSRWRGNIRLSARRRRTDRALAPTTSHVTISQDLQEEIAASDTESSTYRSRSPSPTRTVRSVTSVRASSRASIRSSHPPQTPQFQAPPTNSPPLSPLSAQPPAYHPRPSPPSSSQLHASSELTYPDCSPSSKEPLCFRPQSPPRGDDDSHLASLSGHVATDDKAILSLRAALASAPLGSDSSFPHAASVPSMEEEDMFELPSRSSPTSPSRDTFDYELQPPYSPPTTLLPPPPSKGKQKFDYSHDWDIRTDVDITVDPPLGPSAPPFEESEVMPSAPPLDFDVHVPSAPPMDTEDYPAASTIGGPEHGVGADTVLAIPERADPGGHQSGD